MIKGTKFSYAVIFVILSLLLVPALGDENRRESGSRMESRPRKLLEQTPAVDRRLAVRIYNDWQTDPKAYKLISVPSSGSSVSFDAVREVFPGIKDSAVIVVSGRQQKDEAVAAVMGDSICAERYKKGKRFSIPSPNSGTKGSTEWAVTDALGFAFAKASVDIFVRGVSSEGPYIYLHTVATDDQGLLEVPDLTGGLRYFSFIISKPNYGVSLLDRYIREQKELIMPLVSRTSDAYERSIYGIVMDPEGNPVGGAIIECSNIRTLGEGLIGALHGRSYKSLTDENGAFSFYLPNENIRDERGYLVPPKSKYNVRIEAPKELSLLPYVKPIENGRETMIYFERGERFRSFIFEDANGPMADPKKLQYINLTINRPDGSRVSLRYNDFKDGGCFPPGEYNAVRPSL